jgi:17beta-estradiol 17-dehydrogenase / very-long-chain 3-oxoacyl-CoA reductase
MEYKSNGIIIQSLCPFTVDTKLITNFYVFKNILTPSPDSYVKQALKTIGSQSLTNGYLLHNIMVVTIN